MTTAPPKPLSLDLQKQLTCAAAVPWLLPQWQCIACGSARAVRH